MILGSILFTVNSLMAVNDYSVKCGIDRIVSSDKPIELEYFHAAFLNEGILIKWQILSNDKDLKFELQKSYDGVYFEKLALFDNNCTTEDQFFTFLDTELKLNSEIVYYRLKQIDNKERHNYSDIIYLDSANDIGFNN